MDVLNKTLPSATNLGGTDTRPYETTSGDNKSHDGPGALMAQRANTPKGAGDKAPTTDSLELDGGPLQAAAHRHLVRPKAEGPDVRAESDKSLTALGAHGKQASDAIDRLLKSDLLGMPQKDPSEAKQDAAADDARVAAARKSEKFTGIT